jgi:hypothetical protein
MTPSPLPPPSRGLQILKIILYVMAAFVLLLGLVFGVSLMVSADRMVANLLLPVQLLGIDALSNALAPTLKGFLFNFGVIILVFSLVISALLYGMGRLIGHIIQLETRLDYLEAGFTRDN